MVNDDYDDCPMCQMMKKAEEEGRAPTMAETKQALEESKAQGAIVGGPLMNMNEEVN